jgi:hypothetical protein
MKIAAKDLEDVLGHRINSLTVVINAEIQNKLVITYTKSLKMPTVHQWKRKTVFIKEQILQGS